MTKLINFNRRRKQINNAPRAADGWQPPLAHEGEFETGLDLPVVVGTLLWGAGPHPSVPGVRSYLLDCRHGTTTVDLQRDDDDLDPVILANLYHEHNERVNTTPGVTEWCACRPHETTTPR